MSSAFVTGTLLGLVITGLLAVPVIVLAARAGRRATLLRFAAAAVVVALLCGLLEVGAERLTNQCLDRGNPPYHCNSYGERGMQAVFVAGFGLVALLNAWWLRDALQRGRRR